MAQADAQSRSSRGTWIARCTTCGRKCWASSANLRCFRCLAADRRDDHADRPTPSG